MAQNETEYRPTRQMEIQASHRVGYLLFVVLGIKNKVMEIKLLNSCYTISLTS